MATVSTSFSAGSSTQTMLLSAIPDGLKRLAEQGRGNSILPYFSINELDEIVEGKNLQEHTLSLGDGIYLSQVLPALNWWIEVGKSFLLGRSMKGKFAEPEWEEQRAKMLSLVNDVLSSYAPALAEIPFYSQRAGTSAGLELMKRYRIYTRYVCAFAQEVWPSVDLDWLLKHS